MIPEADAEKMMKREQVMKEIIQKKFAAFFIVFACFLALVRPVQTEDAAVFHVQTAEVKEDGTMEVSVYLTGVTNLGAVDAELIYDPARVSFTDARLGESLQSTYADAYHDEEKSLIKYIALYAEPQEAHGILLQATFQLKEGESYQPQLHVVDIVDNSDEIRDIPYTVEYQQADGSWTDQQDLSGVKAEPEVIAGALETYGSDADRNEAAQNETAAPAQSDQTEEENGAGSGSTKAEMPDDGNVGNEESADSAEESQSGQTAEGNQEDPVTAYAIGGIIAAVLAAGWILSMIRKKR